MLTENGAVLQYIGDLAGNDDLLPASGHRPLPRDRMAQLTSAATSTRASARLFNPASSDEAKQAARDMVGKKFDYLESRLDGGDYLTGSRMSVADPYLFAMLGWTGMHGIDLPRWPNLTAFRNRMAQREAVQAVLQGGGAGLSRPAAANGTP